MPSFSLSRSGRSMGNAVSTSGVIGTGVVRSGGMFDAPDEPQPRTAQQQREYIDALEVERDEQRAAGRDDRVALCEAEIVTAQAEPTRDD
jgi:hypothetical protein